MRATVVLVALQGLSHDDAGQILGCPPGTVAWRMHEARKLLKDAVDPPSALNPLPRREAMK
jgi:RNA polymerase sigma-70 factor (ECF subfamily)